MDLTCIILAAGKGTRMKSAKAKVLHEVCFKPLLHYPIKLANELKCKKVIAVVGHQERVIKERFEGYSVLFATQKEQLGTGHAVTCALDQLDDSDKNILILCGDVPLLKKADIDALIKNHNEKSAAVSVLTADVDDPANYGRIVKDTMGDFIKIVEAKDASPEILRIKEINTGTYIVSKDFLCSALKKIKNENAQKEYYLTDITSIAVSDGKKVATKKISDFKYALGINTRVELAEANEIMQSEINKKHMLNGVTMIAPKTAYIEDSVVIGADSVIHPNVTLTGHTVIGEGTTVQSGSIISYSKIGANTNILPYCIVEDSMLDDKTQIGPFTRLRPGTLIKTGAKIGNFVEIKKSTIGEGSKAGHLSYIGDTTVGNDVNIGAGTITCNYDGINKHRTIIEDYSFIGSNTSLVAPVTIMTGALVGAGTVITKDVPEGTIAVERSAQKHYKRKPEDK